MQFTEAVYRRRAQICLYLHLYFCGDCKETIALYEKAFNIKTESIIRNSDYAPDECKCDDKIAHAVMNIHNQKIFLNDQFGKKIIKPMSPFI